MYSIVNFQVSVFDFPLDQTCARLIVRALNKHFNLPHCEDMTYLHASDWADKRTQKKPFCENILTAVVDKKVKMIYGFTKLTVTVGQNIVSKYNPPLFSRL